MERIAPILAMLIAFLVAFSTGMAAFFRDRGIYRREWTMFGTCPGRH